MTRGDGTIERALAAGRVVSHTIGAFVDLEIAESTFFVVPLFNEAEVIGDVVREILTVCPQVVCVDDGSSDGSAFEAAAAGAHVVQHPINFGQGAALQTGIDYALQAPTTRYLVTYDADGQHQIADAVALLELLAHGDLDIVVGSRFLDSRTRPGAFKRIVLKSAVLGQRWLTGVQLTDAHNGLRALTRETATRLRITQNRMAHASQIVSEMGRLKLRYAEAPVHVLYTDYSRSKGQSLWNSVNILSDLLVK
jgi:glycosyltransferase involved in cell wall biosynthesis